MDLFFISITLIMTAIATTVPGIILVLKRNALIIDGMSHSILLGIVVFLIFTQNLNSPLLIIGGSLSAVIMIILVELINKTKFIPYDAAIGLIFPAFFSLSLLLINTYLKNVHFHKESILMGEIAYLPFNQLSIKGLLIGPKSLYLISLVAIINIAFLFFFSKEIKISIFDNIEANNSGFMPNLLHYFIMILTAFTVMVSFRVVGSILVISFLVVPAISSYLLTYKFEYLFPISLILTTLSSLIGIIIGYCFDWSIVGCVSISMGSMFLVIYVFSPYKGVLNQYKKNQEKQILYCQKILLRHLLNHSNTNDEKEESSLNSFYKHINWKKKFAKKILTQNLKTNLVTINNSIIKLTPKGKKLAKTI